MTEPNLTPNPAEQVPQETNAPLAQPEQPVVEEQRPQEAQLPEWVVKLQGNLKAMQEQVAQWPKQVPAWLSEIVADLPAKVGRRLNLATHLRKLEPPAQKARDKQTREVVTALNRSIATVSKRMQSQLGTQLKDVDRRLKALEKAMAQILRKMK